MILRINKLDFHKEMLQIIFLDLNKKERALIAAPHQMPFVSIATNTQIIAMYFYVIVGNYIIRHVIIKTISALYVSRNKLYQINNIQLRNSN